MPTIKDRKNKDGSVSWVAWVRIRPFRPITKTFEKKTLAKKWADDTERELKAQRRKRDLRPDLTRLTVRMLLTEYLADPETQALNTYDDKHRLASWWMERYGAVKILDFGVLTLREARGLLNRGREAGTVNRYLSEMRSAWNWGRASGLIPKNEVWPERLMLSEPRARVRYLDENELGRVDKAAREDSLLMRAAIRTSIATGLRQSELLRLREEDLDLTGKYSPHGPRVLVRESKNEEQRTVHLPAAAVEALNEYLATKKVRSITGALFTLDDGSPLKVGALNVRWRKIRTAAGLKNFHWHDLRHTCASLLAQGGATLLEIGATLGHKSPAATAKYAHLVQGAATRGHANLNSRLSPQEGAR